MIKINTLCWAHPLVQEWFLSKFEAPTSPQTLGWASILEHKSTLIAAPTGSGKTLAAFLACIDKLIKKSITGSLQAKTEVLYISPLKALSNDVHKNLTEPLKEIKELASLKGIEMSDIEVNVRTGDTLPKERQKMLKKPPHILVTTPESLYILLTAEKSREMLKDINTVIVDEIHAMVGNKRGAHLSLSLERLEMLTQTSPIRIGLSATQKPIEKVAHFLVGNRDLPHIIDKGHLRSLDLSIQVPTNELTAVASNDRWDEIYDAIAKLSETHRTTLVFVNTRRLSERVAHHLKERLGEKTVAAHHGSLSRKLRLKAETALKQGELKILVATASLELGIDIGSIDVVCQIGSPRSISIALQRTGRASHGVGAVSKGIFFPTTIDELLESAAIIFAIKQGDLDELIFPKEPLDILAQQLVALCASQEAWQEQELYQLIKKSYPYQELAYPVFDHILEMLSEGVSSSRGRYGAYLYRDKINGLVKPKRGSRLTAIMNGGAIPETGLFTVVAEPEQVIVGTLDEDFAIESNRGDIILLGSTSWRVQRVENVKGRVIVQDAHGAPPSVPFWLGEAPGRTPELSNTVATLRQLLSDKLINIKPSHILSKMDALENLHLKNNVLLEKQEVQDTLQWLKNHCELNDEGGLQLIEYILQGRAVLGAVPTQKTIIAERFFDESGGMQLIIHAPFGSKINKAWGLALRKKFCRSFNFELQAQATDNGLNISLAEQHSFPLGDVFRYLNPNTVKEVVIQAALQSPIFKTRWRWTATRALALLRFRQGKKIPPNIQRMLSDDLLAAVFPDAAACQDNLGGRDIELPDHPLINETMKDILEDALDIEGLIEVLNRIRDNKIQCLAVDSIMPSVFSNEIINANPYAFLDDAPLEERRARAVQMRRFLPNSVLEEIGKLDKEAILEIQKLAWPDIRNSDELHDFLQSVIVLPESLREGKNASNNIQIIFPEWNEYFEKLVLSHRVGLAKFQNKTFWFATEKKYLVETIYIDAIFAQEMIEIPAVKKTLEESLNLLILGWMQHLGPTTAEKLSQLLSLNLGFVEQTLLRLENNGSVLRGKFFDHTQENQNTQEIQQSEAFPPVIEWCERRLLARIHKLTIANLRKEIQPISAQDFLVFLLKWQHLQPGNQLKTEKGLIEIIKQLQGFELPAKAWERDIFPKRLLNYSKEMLDRLCLTGQIGWGRLSAHPALENKKILPTSIAPITFFIRDDDSYPVKQLFMNDTAWAHMSKIAQEIYEFLKLKGASFFADIKRGIQRLESEVEMGLWELVTLGLITADSFDNLRALIDPKRRLAKRYKNINRHFNAGRWGLLEHYKDTDSIDHEKEVNSACWILLKRYGIVFRDLLVREKNIPPWRSLLIAFRRLEDRGEIRGGRFISGFSGEQFALPIALESLRSIKNQAFAESEITISAVDPLNLFGSVFLGEKIMAVSNNQILIKNGKLKPK